MNLETDSANFITMDEAMKDFAVPDKKNKYYVKAEVHPENKCS